MEVIGYFYVLQFVAHTFVLLEISDSVNSSFMYVLMVMKIKSNVNVKIDKLHRYE